jgi:hypothetical protein
MTMILKDNYNRRFNSSLYLGGRPMWEPMAIAIMCGLLFATLLTLGLVPVLYSLFYKVSYKGFELEA